jgi:uncharacterized protein with HEPN domain
MLNERDINVLHHIIMYCDEIAATIDRFGADYSIFRQDSVYKNATALCVLQIGELTTHLTESFKSTYTGIPWVQIKALRNVVAHNYGRIDDESLWETIRGDIPSLKNYCSQILSNYEMSENDELNSDIEESGKLDLKL